MDRGNEFHKDMAREEDSFLPSILVGPRDDKNWLGGRRVQLRRELMKTGEMQAAARWPANPVTADPDCDTVTISVLERMTRRFLTDREEVKR